MNLTVMLFGKLFDDAQANPRAASLTLVWRIGLGEFIENGLLLSFLYATAVVFYSNAQFTFMTLKRHRNMPVAGWKFSRIR